MNIDIKDCTTFAQATTKIGYNESTRCLNFKSECENLEDAKKCIEIIRAYNDFDYQKVNRALEAWLGVKKYYNADNPNNGNDFFEFSIAREGSPALYISYWSEFSNQYSENGEIKKMTGDEFERRMEAVKHATHADELHFEPEGGMMVARLWWD